MVQQYMIPAVHGSWVQQYMIPAVHGSWVQQYMGRMLGKLTHHTHAHIPRALACLPHPTLPAPSHPQLANWPAYLTPPPTPPACLPTCPNVLVSSQSSPAHTGLGSAAATAAAPSRRQSHRGRRSLQSSRATMWENTAHRHGYGHTCPYAQPACITHTHRFEWAG